MKPEELLKKKEREYGSFAENCAFCFDFYQKNIVANPIISTLPTQKQKVACVGIIMMGLKLARIRRSPEHEDSINDFFGYLELYKRHVGVRIILALNTDQVELLRIKNKANKILEQI